MEALGETTDGQFPPLRTGGAFVRRACSILEKELIFLVNYLYSSRPINIYEKIGGESTAIHPVPGVLFCRFRGFFP